MAGMPFSVLERMGSFCTAYSQSRNALVLALAPISIPLVRALIFSFHASMFSLHRLSFESMSGRSMRMPLYFIMPTYTAVGLSSFSTIHWCRGRYRWNQALNR